jgi:hypothetical protein
MIKKSFYEIEEFEDISEAQKMKSFITDFLYDLSFIEDETIDSFIDTWVKEYLEDP